MPNIAGALGVLGSGAGLLRNIKRQTFKRNPGGTQYSTAPVDVRADIDQFGIQKQNLGITIFGTPPILARKYPKALQYFSSIYKRSEQFNVPGTVIQTSDVRRYGYGPTSRVPVGNVTSSNFTINMIADQQGIYYELMQVWMDGIVSRLGRGNGKNLSMSSIQNDTHLYEVSYKEDYATTITLLEFDDKFNTIISTDLIQAYPVAIQDKAINWGGSGLINFTVDFAYTAADTRIDNFEQIDLVFSRRSNTALYASILKGAALLQSLSSAKKGGGIANVIGVVAAGAAALNTVGGLRR